MNNNPLGLITKLEILQKRDIYKSDAKIAQELGVTRQALHLQCKKLGVPPIRSKESLEAKRALIIKAHLEGKSAYKITYELNISGPTVYRVIKKYTEDL
jgi:transcriptional regulator with PAS, ATPase and Fis domain